MKEKQFVDDDLGVQKQIMDYKKRKAINCAGFQRLIDWCCDKTREHDEEEEYDISIMKCFYEYPQFDLQSEINSRRSNNRLNYFSHKELTNMMYMTLIAFRYLNDLGQKSKTQYLNGMSYDDIRPSFIGIDKDFNHFYLLDRMTNIDIASVEHESQDNYISNRN